MARLLPSDISHLALAGAREPELETLRQLQAKLPAAYTVFHGVHWSREYKSDIKFGELDFVVVNQGGKVLVIEQKNGQLEETANGLVKVYPERAKSRGRPGPPGPGRRAREVQVGAPEPGRSGPRLPHLLP